MVWLFIFGMNKFNVTKNYFPLAAAAGSTQDSAPEKHKTKKNKEKRKNKWMKQVTY